MAELSLPGAGLPLEWHGEDLVLLPGRALWLPRLAALVIADWHLGKDDVLRRAGIALPAGSLDGELARLDGLLAHTLARELVVLGDLVHGAVHRGAPWQQALSRWRLAHRALRLRVARGNHDGDIGALATVIDEIAPVIALGALRGVHASDPRDPAPSIGGHLHPVVHLRAGRQRERVPVFWLQDRQLVLPSFGRLTGGWPLPPGAGGRTYAALERSVIALPDGRPRRRSA